LLVIGLVRKFALTMKKIVVTIALILAVFGSQAQCSVCTKTAQQLGEKPAKALNNAIIYLMLTPFVIMGYIGFRWYKNQKAVEQQEQQN
jgi:hypothetical protein